MFVLFFSILFGSIFEKPASIHAFHLSRCEVNYDVKGGELQIAAYVFIDDLEKAIALTGKKKLSDCGIVEKEYSEEVIEAYFNKKLIFSVDGKPRFSKFIGKEQSADQMAYWCYLEISQVSKPGYFEIENSVLTEIYNDQKNIVEFSVDKKRRSFVIFDFAKRIEKIFML